MACDALQGPSIGWTNFTFDVFRVYVVRLMPFCPILVWGKSVITSNKEFSAPTTSDRRMKRARLVRDGMSWRAACLQAGYSLSVANKGPRGYAHGGRNRIRTMRPGVLKDFERAAQEVIWKPDQLKKIVTHRLATAVVEGKTSNVAREAELIGRMRDVDLFVRNADVHVGIWGVLSDLDAKKSVDADVEAIDNFKD